MFKMQWKSKGGKFFGEVNTFYIVQCTTRNKTHKRKLWIPFYVGYEGALAAFLSCTGRSVTFNVETAFKRVLHWFNTALYDIFTLMVEREGSIKIYVAPCPTLCIMQSNCIQRIQRVKASYASSGYCSLKNAHVRICTCIVRKTGQKCNMLPLKYSIIRLYF